MDDLFGDLPAAKNSAPIENNVTSTSSNAAAAASGVSASLPASTQSVPSKPKEPNQTKPTSSLVNQLGTAGTSMAFVPQALRKKKRPPQQQTKKVEEKRQRVESDVQNELDRSTVVEDVNGFPVADIVIHDKTNDATESQDSNQEDPINDENDNGEPYLENEHPSLRALHDAAKTSLTPYNPHNPNDYLAYRERKKTAAVRKDMQAAALAKLEAHDRLRKKVEEERRRIELSGDVDKIVESRLSSGGGAGRGRGRGMSNLPAWLIKKQMEEKEGGGGAVAEVEKGQFDDAQNGR